MEVQNGKERGEQDGRGLSRHVVQYTSLHGYIRNTPPDTEVHVEHPLRMDRHTWPAEKNI